MKVYCIVLYSTGSVILGATTPKMTWTESSKPIRLAEAFDLGSISYFYRSTVQEHLLFGSKTIIERAPLGVNFTVELKKDFDYVFHTFINSFGLAGCVVTDQEYPAPTAYKVLHQAMNQYKSDTLPDLLDRTGSLRQLLIKSQNPLEIDKLAKIQSQLDEIKDIMHSNIQSLLERGETLDSLMEKSQDLSDSAKIFYQKARKTNSCCRLY